MKITCHLERADHGHNGSEQPDGSVIRIVGDVFDSYSVTTGVGMVAKPRIRWLRPGDSMTTVMKEIGLLANSVAVETV